MNTTQNYSNQSANTTGTESFEQRLIQVRYSQLHQIIGDFMLEAGAAMPVGLVTELFRAWTNQTISNGGPELGKTYPIKTSELDTVFTTFSLMNFLTAVGEKWGEIKSLEERLSRNA